MPTCSAYKCGNNSRFKKEGTVLRKVSFHRFPKEPLLRELWTRAVNRRNWEPASHATLCCEHFLEQDMDRTSLSCVRVRDKAVPSIFPECVKDHAMGEEEEPPAAALDIDAAEGGLSAVSGSIDNPRNTAEEENLHLSKGVQNITDPVDNRFEAEDSGRDNISTDDQSFQKRSGNSDLARLLKRLSHNKCCFPGCSNSKAKRPDLPFHRFPVIRKKTCEKWLVKCNDKSLRSIPKCSLYKRVVCGEHFSKGCYGKVRNHRLLPNAVPGEEIKLNNEQMKDIGGSKRKEGQEEDANDMTMEDRVKRLLGKVQVEIKEEEEIVDVHDPADLFIISDEYQQGPKSAASGSKQEEEPAAKRQKLAEPQEPSTSLDKDPLSTELDEAGPSTSSAFLKTERGDEDGSASETSSSHETLPFSVVIVKDEPMDEEFTMKTEELNIFDDHFATDSNYKEETGSESIIEPSVLQEGPSILPDPIYVPTDKPTSLSSGNDNFKIESKSITETDSGRIMVEQSILPNPIHAPTVTSTSVSTDYNEAEFQITLLQNHNPEHILPTPSSPERSLIEPENTNSLTASTFKLVERKSAVKMVSQGTSIDTSLLTPMIPKSQIPPGILSVKIPPVPSVFRTPVLNHPPTAIQIISANRLPVKIPSNLSFPESRSNTQPSKPLMPSAILPVTIPQNRSILKTSVSTPQPTQVIPANQLPIKLPSNLSLPESGPNTQQPSKTQTSPGILPVKVPPNPNVLKTSQSNKTEIVSTNQLPVKVLLKPNVLKTSQPNKTQIISTNQLPAKGPSNPSLVESCSNTEPSKPEKPAVTKCLVKDVNTGPQACLVVPVEGKTKDQKIETQAHLAPKVGTTKKATTTKNNGPKSKKKEDEYDIFGKYVANSLRSIKQQKYKDKLLRIIRNAVKGVCQEDLSSYTPETHLFVDT